MTVWVPQDEHIDAHVDGVQVAMRLRRRQQQDGAYVGSGVVAVAAGMGGHADGAAASQVAPEALAALDLALPAGLRDRPAHGEGLGRIAAPRLGVVSPAGGAA